MQTGFLTPAQKVELDQALLQCFKHYLGPANRNIGSSYHLKHVFETNLGFYISNYDLKEAMKRCEFYPDSLELNPYYKIKVTPEYIIYLRNYSKRHLMDSS